MFIFAEYIVISLVGTVIDGVLWSGGTGTGALIS